MALNDIHFRSSYNRVDHSIYNEFYLPCMVNASKYDRMTGYFSSTVYIIAWDALREFINHGGHIRILCSHVLSSEDKDALYKAEASAIDSAISQALEKELKEMLQNEDIAAPAKLLACLIAKGIVTIKFVLIKEDGHPITKKLFHGKVGIFYDNKGNSVAFDGSFNETGRGLSDEGNIEFVDVFVSWEQGKDPIRIAEWAGFFERLWSGQVDEKQQVYDLPDAIKKSILDIATKENIEDLLKEINITSIRKNKWKPKTNGLTPKKHQVDALENWMANDRKGILKHATGSGKTFTAICAIHDALKINETILILVPSKELLHQWKQNIKSSISGEDIHIFLCGDGKTDWKKYLSQWTSNLISEKKIIISIMATACSKEFLDKISGGGHIFLVADEVHNLGSIKRRGIFTINVGPRLGLSATPERYGDPEGTKAIFDFFGPIIEPEYTLQDAIKDNVLTRYMYLPQKVTLTQEEQLEWDDLTSEISQKISKLPDIIKSKLDFFNLPPNIKNLFIKRSRIIKNASKKIDLALNILKKDFKKNQNQKWIVYCDNQSQLKKIVDGATVALSGVVVLSYYAAMEGDRDETLKYFSKNGGVLVAIKCLDEGVDIPSITHAIILASSKNPREFIQRRGRILRLSPGKYLAYLYDAITLPNDLIYDKSINIVLSELSRAIQFGSWAVNQGCISELKDLALGYGIDYEDYVNGGYEDDAELEQE